VAALDVFARRIAGFDKAVVEGTKALLDWASLPPDEEFGAGLAAFYQTSGRPENATRVMYLFENGLQTPAWNWTWDALWANLRARWTPGSVRAQPEHPVNGTSPILPGANARVRLMKR